MFRTTLAALVLSTTLGATTASANPMSWAGEEHNALLDCVMSISPDMTAEEIFEALVTPCGYNPLGTGGTLEHTDDWIAARAAILEGSDLTLPLSEVARDAGLPRFHVRVMSFVDRAGTMSQDDAAAYLENLEQTATRRLGRSSPDLAVLATISTARHSLQFWQDYDAANPPETSTRARRPWWVRVLADAAGAVVGWAVDDNPVGMAVAFSKAARDGIAPPDDGGTGTGTPTDPADGVQ